MTAAGLVLAVSIAAGMSPIAAQEHAGGKKYEKGSTVTLQGCVVAAEKKDTYVLTHVREWPISNTDMGIHGKRMYWIDKESKSFKAHLGHTIEVTGKITDISKSEMEIKAGEAGAGLNVEIEGPGRDVVTPAVNAGVNPEGRPNKSDIPITLIELKVEDIRMTSSTCSSTF
jgi:hypothetical protein